RKRAKCSRSAWRHTSERDQASTRPGFSMWPRLHRLPIEPVAAYVFENGGRNFRGRFAASQPAPDFGRRSVKRHVLKPVNGRSGGSGIDVARPARYDELYRSHHVLPSPPGLDLRKGVGANQEKEPVAGSECRLQLFDRVNGITARCVRFQAGGLKSRNTTACQFHHPVAVFIGSAAVL